MEARPDISTRRDIESLVRSFYREATQDEIIGVFFTDTIEINWDAHFPVMFDFWETMLLGNMKYKGNPMTKHFDLNKKRKLEEKHFDRWLELWKATVLKNFEGKIASVAIERAGSIAQLMHFKMQQFSPD